MIVGSVFLIVGAVALLVGGVVNGSNPLILGSMASTVLAAIVLVVGVRQSADDADAPPGDNTPTQVIPPVPGDATRWDRSRGMVAATRPVGASQVAASEQGTVPAAAGAARVPAARTAESRPAGQAAAVAGVGAGGLAGAGGTGKTEAGNQRTDGRSTTGPAGDDGLSAVDQTDTTAADSTAEGAVDDEFDDEVPADEPDVETVTVTDAERVQALDSEVVVIDGRPRYHVRGCVHLLGRDSEPLPVADAIELGFTPCALCEPGRTLLLEAQDVADAQDVTDAQDLADAQNLADPQNLTDAQDLADAQDLTDAQDVTD